MDFILDLGETDKIDLFNLSSRVSEKGPKNVKWRPDSKFFRGEPLPTDRFSYFFGEAVGDTQKKPVELLVDLSEMNNFHYCSDPFLPTLLPNI